MTEQKTARTISSFVTPTEDDLAYFESLSPSEQQALLRVELDKGAASGLSTKTFDQIVAEARAKFATRRSGNA